MKERILSLKNKIKEINYLNLGYLGLVLITIILTLIYGEYTIGNDGSFSNGVTVEGAIGFSIPLVILFSVIYYLAFKFKIIRLENKITIGFIFVGLIIIYLSFLTLLHDYDHLYFQDLEDPSKNIYPPISMLDRLVSISQVIFACLLWFMVFNMVPEFKKNNYFLLKALFAANILVAIVILGYSFITEGEKYITIITNPAFFTKFDLGNNTVRIKSFFNNGNTIGHMMFLTSLSTTLLSILYKKYWMLLLNIIYIFFIICSGSRTAFICTFTFLVLTYFYFIYKSFYKNKLLFTILLSITIFVFIYLILDIFFIQNFKISEDVEDKETGNIETVTYTLYDLILKYFSKIDGRFDIIRQGYSNYNIYDILFGVGYNISTYLLRSLDNIGPNYYNYHNAFVEVFSTGGVFLSICYLAVFIIIILKLANIIRHDKKNTGYLLMFIFMLTPYFIYMFSEDFPIFFITTGGIDITIVLFGFIISKNNIVNKNIYDFTIIYNNSNNSDNKSQRKLVLNKVSD